MSNIELINILSLLIPTKTLWLVWLIVLILSSINIFLVWKKHKINNLPKQIYYLNLIFGIIFIVLVLVTTTLIYNYGKIL